MADGTGDDGMGAPTLAQLKQLAWDINYIRAKLTHGGVAKDFIWRKYSGHQMVLGKIKIQHWNLIGGFRAIASRVAAGEDGPAPSVADFGEIGWNQSTFADMYNDLTTISAKIMMSKRTLVMRANTLEESVLELLLGDIEITHTNYRLAIRALADNIAEGRG